MIDFPDWFVIQQDAHLEHRIDAAIDVWKGPRYRVLHSIKTGTVLKSRDEFRRFTDEPESEPDREDEYSVIEIIDGVFNVLWKGGYGECNRWLEAERFKEKLAAFFNWSPPGAVDDDVPF